MILRICPLSDNDLDLEYLRDSLDEIEVVYDPRYDYNTATHEQFIQHKYQEVKDHIDYVGKNKGEMLNQLAKKYYRERAFNLLKRDNYGFKCYDRMTKKIEGADVELMDLYKDETLFAVKFGNTSSKLCYAVDQSITTAKLYKHKLIEGLPMATKMAVWLVLDRRSHLPTENGKPNINRLDMLSLKNKLDNWKKEIRLLGYTPIIMINR